MGISWMLQLRLINSLAYLGGYDLNSENVRTLAFVLLLGKRAEDFFLEKIIGAGALGVMKEGSKSIMKKLIPQFTSQITIKGGIKVVPILSGIVGTSVDVLMTHAIAKVAKQTFLKTTIECESFVRMEEERIKLLINMGIVDMYFCNEEKTLILEIIKNSSIPDSKKDVFCRDIENSPSKLYSIDYTLFRKEIQEKMWPLPISDLFMAGHSSVETLRKLEIQPIGDLAKADPKLIELHLKSHGRKLWEFANGLDDSEVESVRAEAKGVGNSTTLPKDLITEAEALPVLKDLAVSVGRRLRKAGQKAGMVSVEIKYHTFNQVSHQKQMERQTNQDQDIYQASIELFRELWSGEPIRLLGIRTSKLSEESEPEQLSLFDMKFESEETRKKKKNLKEALKKLEGKYGDGIVKKGW